MKDLAREMKRGKYRIRYLGERSSIQKREYGSGASIVEDPKE